jgi:integrase
LVAANHRLEGLFVVGLMLGLRPEELTGLRWTDVDLAAGRLVVDGSLKNERKTLRLGRRRPPSPAGRCAFRRRSATPSGSTDAGSSRSAS